MAQVPKANFLEAVFAVPDVVLGCSHFLGGKYLESLSNCGSDTVFWVPSFWVVLPILQSTRYLPVLCPTFWVV